MRLDSLPTICRRLALVAAQLLTAPCVVGQCAPLWLPGPAANCVMMFPNVLGSWDPDGPGPRAPVFVVAGGFDFASAVVANNIALFDPSNGQWSALGAGTDGDISAIATLANGDLVVGGAFAHAGGVPAAYVARWDGVAWSTLGPGLPGPVSALLGLPNGDLLANCQSAGFPSPPVSPAIRWDGQTWTPLGVPSLTGTAHEFARLPNGDIVAAGSFADWAAPPGSMFVSVIRWNGVIWAPLGTGPDGDVRSLRVLPNGDLVAGGWFTHAGSVTVNGVARWDGSGWNALGLGAGATGLVGSLHVLPNGDLLAAGSFTLAGGVDTVARWDGSTWSPFATGLGAAVARLAVVPNGDLLALVSPDATAPDRGNLAHWRNGAWQGIGPGLNGWISSMAPLPDGGLVGTIYSPASSRRVARWDGVAWTTFGVANGQVLGVTVLPNGDVVAAGWFTMIDGVAAIGTARWNGATWAPLVTGPAYDVTKVFALPNGDIVGTSHLDSSSLPGHILRWSGAAWSAMGTGLDGPPGTFAALPNGDLVTAGLFTMAGGVAVQGLARWNGATWSNFAPGLGAAPWTIAVLPNGDLVASFAPRVVGGVSTTVARWDGAGWSPLGTGPGFGPRVLAALPDGGVLAAASSSMTGTSGQFAAYWDGMSWHAFSAPFDGPVWDARALANGDVAVIGRFASVDGVTTPLLARLSTTCPAAVASYGASCLGSGGANVLTTSTGAWAGGVYRAEASGMPATGIVATVLGLVPTPVPLPTILPVGVPGCLAWVPPDILGYVLPTGGVARYEVPIPRTPTMVGATFYHQMLPIETDAVGNFVSFTGTNALQLTVGSY